MNNKTKLKDKSDNEYFLDWPKRNGSQQYFPPAGPQSHDPSARWWEGPPCPGTLGMGGRAMLQGNVVTTLVGLSERWTVWWCRSKLIYIRWNEYIHMFTSYDFCRSYRIDYVISYWPLNLMPRDHKLFPKRVRDILTWQQRVLDKSVTHRDLSHWGRKQHRHL